MSKLWASTFFCAPSMARVSMRCSMGSSSFMPSVSISLAMRSAPKMRIRSSSRDRKKMRGARVALAAGAAAQLVVDAARLVALGAEDVEAARGDHLVVLLGGLHLELRGAPGQARPLDLAGLEGLVGSPSMAGVGLGADLVLGHHLRVAAEDDVGAAAGHVGGDGDRALAAGLGDDLGLALVVLGVQHVVRDAALLEQRGDDLALLHRDGADQDGLPLVVAVRDLVADGVELLALGLVDHVLRVGADRSPGWSGRSPRRACRSWRTPPPRSRPCRSCRPASCTCGSSSGR